MIKWLAAALLVIMLQVFFLSSLTSLYPYLTLILVIIAAARLPLPRSLTVALWTGFLLDSLSMHDFGLFMVTYLGAWAIAGWLRQTGIVFSSITGMVAAVLLLTFWQGLVVMGLFALQANNLEVLRLLPLHVGQFALTAVFAIPLRRLL